MRYGVDSIFDKQDFYSSLVACGNQSVSTGLDWRPTNKIKTLANIKSAENHGYRWGLAGRKKYVYVTINLTTCFYFL